MASSIACPFCGKTNTRIDSNYDASWILCLDCEARGPAIDKGDYVDAAERVAEVYNTWEKRPVEDALTARIVGLELLLSEQGISVEVLDKQREALEALRRRESELEAENKELRSNTMHLDGLMAEEQELMFGEDEP